MKDSQGDPRKSGLSRRGFLTGTSAAAAAAGRPDRRTDPRHRRPARRGPRRTGPRRCSCN